MKKAILLWNQVSLVKKIVVGLLIGIVLGIILPQVTMIGMLGDIFVGALKAAAPILVLCLVMSSLSKHEEGTKTNMKLVIILYLLGTFLAGALAVVMSFIFPITLSLSMGETSGVAPGGIGEVLHSLILNIVSNPIDALMNANYIGILTWAVLLGIALRKASNTTKKVIEDFSEGISKIVRWVIQLAPFGVMGIVFTTISKQGIGALKTYGNLILLLVGTMAIDALIINPMITFAFLKKNPYPLVLRCLRESGITAFFTRSSAANIPVI